MTDLTPVDNTMSDDEFDRLILISDHAPGPEPLSPAA